MMSLYGLLCATLITGVMGAVDQHSLDNIASNLHVQFEIVDNLFEVVQFKFQIRLTNKGSLPINVGDWSIFFCFIQKVSSVDKGPGKITHINGCLHRIRLEADIPQNEVVTLDATANAWMVARTDVMPNWYVAADVGDASLSPRVLASTAGESLDFVTPFDKRQKWKRHGYDEYNPYTAEVRYDRNKAVAGNCKKSMLVIPAPLKIEGKYLSGTACINKQWKIASMTSSLNSIAKFLADKTNIQMDNTNPSSNNRIVLSIGNVDGLPDDIPVDAKAEAYKITVNGINNRIMVVGASEAGVFYGAQTVLSALFKNYDVNRHVCLWGPSMVVTDAPRYSYRGFMLDVARNFRSKDDVMKLLDLMASCKLNKFHFHLTDDEGWRLEIPGLPELTTIGSQRCHDLQEKTCTIPQLGSEPVVGGLGSGYYSVNDYKEILQYAAERHIEVIPEFDMPGHSHAAIVSMLARYHKYKDTNMAEATKYLLVELGDPSEYVSVQLYNDNAINPCIDSTYTFITKIVQELKNMHDDAKVPLRVFHYGGDESPHGAWKKSKVCDNVRATGVTNLGEYFALKVSEITSSVNMGSWEDGLLDDKVYERSAFKNPDVIAYPWQNIWEWGAGNRAYRLANAGYKVVMTQATNLYFDHPYEPDPEERGYYWAPRYTDTLRVFKFQPDSLYDNIETKRSGETYTRAELCANPDNCTPLMKPENIIGMEGAMWSETVRTADQMWSMVTPRLLALAERAWHKAEWETESDEQTKRRLINADWQRFANIVGNYELTKLDGVGISYHIPPPGAKLDCIVKNNILYVNTAIPGLQVQWSDTNGVTWNDYQPYTRVYGKVLLRTRSTDGKRLSRVVELMAPSREELY